MTKYEILSMALPATLFASLLYPHRLFSLSGKGKIGNEKSYEEEDVVSSSSNTNSSLGEQFRIWHSASIFSYRMDAV